MSTSKPHIKAKAEPDRQRSEPPLRDPPVFAERDPPIFTERDPDTESKTDEHVLFRENDCLG